jgi:TPR repeat protein
MNNLGFMYKNGLGGLPKNEVEAVRLYRIAADKGDDAAMRHLGQMYEEGRGGLTRNPHEAARWYVASLTARDTVTLNDFKTKSSSFGQDVRRAIVERLKSEGHYSGPVTSTFTPAVIAAMERLVAGGK